MVQLPRVQLDLGLPRDSDQTRVLERLVVLGARVEWWMMVVVVVGPDLPAVAAAAGRY